MTGVSDSKIQPGGGTLPTAIIHLSELQWLTGQTEGDAVDQILVKTTSPSVQDELETVYPNAHVVARSGSSVTQLADTGLPLEMALTAILISIIEGALFMATTMGLEIAGDIRSYAMLRAIGLSTPTIVLLVTLQTVTVTALGGVIGTALVYRDLYLSNSLAQQ